MYNAIAGASDCTAILVLRVKESAIVVIIRSLAVIGVVYGVAKVHADREEDVQADAQNAGPAQLRDQVVIDQHTKQRNIRNKRYAEHVVVLVFTTGVGAVVRVD